MVFSIIFIIAVVGACLILLQANKKHFEALFMLMAFVLGLMVQYDGNTSDITRYLLYPALYRDISWSMIFMESDYIFQIFAKLFSYITSSPRLFAIVMYMIYAKLFLESFKMVTDHFDFKTNVRQLYILGLFTIIPFTYFNALRFALALLVFLLCILKVFVEQKRFFLIVIFLAPLIHFSFWIMIPLPFIALGLSKRLGVAIAVLIISIFLSGFNTSLGIMQVTEDVFSETISERAAGYGSEFALEYQMEKQAAGNEMLNIRGRLVYFSMEARNYAIQYSLLIMSLICYRLIKEDERILKLITLLLYAFALSNIASSVSHGARFFHFATALAIFILYYIKRVELNKRFVKKNKLFYVICFVAAIYYGLSSMYASRFMFD